MTSDRSYVLLIDDEQDILALSKLFLEDDGTVSVTTAQSADIALELLKTKTFDAIISDYYMPPGMNSIQLLKILRECGNNTPFIIFTGKSREEVAIEALNNGASFYLEKGGTPEVQFAELKNMIVQLRTRRQAELAYRKSEERNRMLIDHVPAVIYNAGYTDDDALILAINPEFQKLTGWPREEWIGRSLLSLVHPDDVASVRIMKHTDPVGTAVHKYEVRVGRSGGDYITGEFVTSPVIEQGSVTGEFGIIRDVSEERRITGLLIARSAELEEKNRELESFCYSVSHDLRAPLRIVDGYAKILELSLPDPIPQKASDGISRIRAASARMNRIIEDLLKLSRVGRADLNIEKVDLSRIAGDIIESHIRAEPGRSVKVFIRPGITAWCDRSLIRIALENLLGNAWKFTGKESDAEISFDFERKKSGGMVYVIRDNGAGFDFRRAGNLFMPFSRYHTESEFPGIGIGLATTKKIIQRHGGHISAQSEPGKGATFFFSLDTEPVEPV